MRACKVLVLVSLLFPLPNLLWSEFPLFGIAALMLGQLEILVFSWMSSYIQLRMQMVKIGSERSHCA